MGSVQQPCGSFQAEEASGRKNLGGGSRGVAQTEGLELAEFPAAGTAEQKKTNHVSFKLSGCTTVQGCVQEMNERPCDEPQESSPWVSAVTWASEEPAMECTFQCQHRVDASDETIAKVDLTKKQQPEEETVATERQRQHGTGHVQNKTPKEALSPSNHVGGLQEAMTLLATATCDLEEKVNSLLFQHEEDFFAAFRSLMAEIQSHVECLRDCADAQKNLMMRDLKVKTLQKELKWFVEEAGRLDQACKKLKGDLLSWKARTEALREDRAADLQAHWNSGQVTQQGHQFLGSKHAKPQNPAIEESNRSFTVLGSLTPSRKKAANLAPSGTRAKRLGELWSTDIAAAGPTNLRQTVEALTRQVVNLSAANSRLHNEVKRNSRREQAVH
ncbi:hypothetical protein Efla_004876 [Eimeria flavescens]